MAKGGIAIQDRTGDDRSSRVSARARAYRALKDAIVRAELEPGRRLSENELAALLGVSRTPVREALARLRDERLVVIVPQLGTFVTRISTVAVGDAQFIREALECASVREAAVNATDADIAALQANLAAQERARDEHDADAFYALDDAFHKSLCDLSRHREVWGVSQRAKSHLNRVRRLSIPVSTYLEDMIPQHRRVLAAVAAHDADRAEQELRHHLRDVLQAVPAIRAQHPDFFDEET